MVAAFPLLPPSARAPVRRWKSVAVGAFEVSFIAQW